MTIQEFAKMLNGRENNRMMTQMSMVRGKELGFVTIFGYSDDGTEIHGAIEDEVGCFEGGTIYLDGERLLEECDCECSYYQLAKEKCKLINIIWHDEEGEPCWTYETDIPHATFDVIEDGEVWCRGIVFDVKSLEEKDKVKEDPAQRITHLLDLIEIYSQAGILREEFTAFTGYDEPIETIDALIDAMEVEMSYWELEGELT